MEDIDKNRKICVPSFNMDSFDKIKEEAGVLLEAYEKTEDEIPDMLMIVYSRKNEDGTYTVYMCATPENELSEVKLFDSELSLKINRK